MKVIYVVTVFQKISHNHVNDEDNTYIPEFGERRCVGWFESLSEAKYAVENNFSNIRDDLYNYAIIEQMEPGILIPDIDRFVYIWDKNTKLFTPIETPEELSKVSNFGIG